MKEASGITPLLETRGIPKRDSGGEESLPGARTVILDPVGTVLEEATAQSQTLDPRPGGLNTNRV